MNVSKGSRSLMGFFFFLKMHEITRGSIFLSFFSFFFKLKRQPAFRFVCKNCENTEEVKIHGEYIRDNE